MLNISQYTIYIKTRNVSFIFNHGLDALGQENKWRILSLDLFGA